VSKSAEGEGPYLLDLILDGTLDLLINTPLRTGKASDEGRWRAAANTRAVPLMTTLEGAFAAIAAIKALRRAETGEQPPLQARPIQSYYRSS